MRTMAQRMRDDEDHRLALCGLTPDVRLGHELEDQACRYYDRDPFASGVTEWPYVWAWDVRPQPSRKGQACRVLVRGTMNSALIEFEDDFRVVTSRNGLRRA